MKNNSKKITTQWLWWLSWMNEVETKIIEKKNLKTNNAITAKDLFTMRRAVD